VKVVLDMNLSPLWVRFLANEGIEAVHWASVGDPRAPDAVVMTWVRERESVVITHDLDFSALLATTDATGPSVLQVRTGDVLPDAIGNDVVAALRDHARALEDGAIVRLNKLSARVRILPIRGRRA
jgi:predicted nuclease of predicted toxin-antitoxin system